MNGITEKRRAKLPPGCRLDSPTLGWALERLAAIEFAAYSLSQELKIAHDPLHMPRTLSLVDPPNVSPRAKDREKDSVRFSRAADVQAAEWKAWAAIEAKALQSNQPPKGWRIATASDGTYRYLAKDDGPTRSTARMATPKPSKAKRATNKRPAKRRRTGVA